MAATKRRGVISDDMVPLTCGPLAHPLRVRILEITNERDISPSVFVDEGLAPKGVTFKDRAHALSHVAYHFRVLDDAGCVEVIETFQRRGATEHIYRGTATVEFTTEEFSKLSKDKRRMLSRTAMQALVARVDGAFLADTFDSRTNRFLVMEPLYLDERGWEEFIEVLDSSREEVKRINADARERLGVSGEEVIPATYGAAGFVSPPPPPVRGSGERE